MCVQHSVKQWQRGTNLKINWKEVKHPEIPEPCRYLEGGEKETHNQSTSGGNRSNSSNPIMAQPPSLLSKPASQLICPEGDSDQGERVRVSQQHDKLCGKAQNSPFKTGSSSLEPLPYSQQNKTKRGAKKSSREDFRLAGQTCAERRHRLIYEARG